jgi:hypothetical protein
VLCCAVRSVCRAGGSDGCRAGCIMSYFGIWGLGAVDKSSEGPRLGYLISRRSASAKIHCQTVLQVMDWVHYLFVGEGMADILLWHRDESSRCDSRARAHRAGGSGS